MGDRRSSTSRLTSPEAENPGSDPVCPRCGAAAEGHDLCHKCGLNLLEQAELPTRDTWEGQVLDAMAEFAAEGSAPGPRRRRLPLLLLVLVAVLASMAVIAWLVLDPGGDPGGTAPSLLSGAAGGDSSREPGAVSPAEQKCIGDWNSWVDTPPHATPVPGRSPSERRAAVRVSLYEGRSSYALNPGDCVITLVDDSRDVSVFASVQSEYENVVRSAPRVEVKKLAAAARSDPNVGLEAGGRLSAR